MDLSASKVIARGPDGHIKMPPAFVEMHPRGFFFEVNGGGMSRVIPNGAMVLVDPDVEPKNGSIVAAELADGEPYLRRMYRGQDTLMLAADGYEDREDMVFKGTEADSVLILGTVVWYQPNGEVG